MTNNNLFPCVVVTVDFFKKYYLSSDKSNKDYSIFILLSSISHLSILPYTFMQR